MVLPIHVFGSPVLREPTETIESDSPELQQFIDDMIETMHGATGIGLAAPQVGEAKRLFIIDLTPFEKDYAEEGIELPPMPMVFINPEIVEESEEETEFEEGCLSIPDLRERVWRPEAVRLTYQDRHLAPHEIEVDGMMARVIQHEYDHLEGVLFTDLISPLRRRLLRRRLRGISEGDVEADYPLHIRRKKA
ncbi:MAG: peptide deformylase [Rhodothermales bacterium]